MLLDAHPDIGGYESYALMILPVDPPGSPMRLLAEGTARAAWVPNQSEITFGYVGTFTVLRFPNGDPVNTWTTGENTNSQLIWSPTGAFLATAGNIPGAYEAALSVADARE